MSRLVIRAPNWVGDLAMATPVLAAAAEDPRWDEVHVVLRAHLAPLITELPFPLELHPIESHEHEAETLAGLGADAALLLTSSLRSAWLARRAGIPIRAGSGTGLCHLLYTHAVRPTTIRGRRAPTPTAHLFRDVAGLLGLAVADLHPRLAAPLAARRSVRGRLGFEGPYVLASPGAAFGAAKLWPPERFAAALDDLAGSRGWEAVVVGGPGEESLTGAVTAAANLPVHRLQADLAELRSLVAEAELLLVGDSGPRWIAAAFDVPCVSVLGPTFPEQTATSLEFTRIVRLEGLECAPCLERRCPLGHHRCMNDLAVERVVAAASELLG